jgi:ribosome-associated heat shock protein Hsp15
MSASKEVRIDKFLWAMRLYKTRGLATDACHMGRILLNGTSVKPSREVRENDMMAVRKPPVTYVYRVIATVENRQPAKLVNNFIEDLTPDSEKVKLEIRDSIPVGHRKKGTGRPTKKERRVIDKWHDDIDS